MRSASAIQLFLVAAIVAMAALLALELRGGRIDDSALRDVRQENLLWNAAQLQIEALRYGEALSALRAARTPDAADWAIARFDILWSRSALFQTRVGAQHVRALDRDGVARTIADFLLRHEATGPDPLAAPDAELRAMTVELRGLHKALQGFTSAVMDFEERRLDKTIQAIRAGNRESMLRALIALAAAALIAVISVAQVRVERRKLVEQQALTRRAEVAAATRSRFLTMMSHELRTPMNGVIGMLALAEHRVADDGLRGSLAVARRSALALSELLEDILDLSELQTEAPAADLTRVSAETLAQEIARAIERRRAEAAQTLRIELPGDPTAPVLLNADALVKAATQVALFFIDRLDAQELTVCVQRRGRHLVTKLSAPAGARPTWRPEAFIGALSDETCAIQTDAIGPVLAQGLIRRMGAKSFVHRRADGVAAIAIVAPVTWLCDAAPIREDAALTRAVA